MSHSIVKLCNAYTTHKRFICSLIPRLSNLFNIHEKRGGGGGLGSNIKWQLLLLTLVCHEREAVSSHLFWIGPSTSVYKTQLFEIILHSLEGLFGPHLPSTSNGSVRKYGSPTLNYHDLPPFLSLYMGWHLSHNVRSHFTCVCWKRLGEPWDEASSYAPYLRKSVSLGEVYRKNFVQVHVYTVMCVYSWYWFAKTAANNH